MWVVWCRGSAMSSRHITTVLDALVVFEIPPKSYAVSRRRDDVVATVASRTRRVALDACVARLNPPHDARDKPAGTRTQCGLSGQTRLKRVDASRSRLASRRAAASVHRRPPPARRESESRYTAASPSELRVEPDAPDRDPCAGLSRSPGAAGGPAPPHGARASTVECDSGVQQWSAQTSRRSLAALPVLYRRWAGADIGSTGAVTGAGQAQIAYARRTLSPPSLVLCLITIRRPLLF